MLDERPGYECAVGATLAWHRRVAPDRFALRFTDGELTYAELDDLANRTANGLAAAGIVKGAQVGMMMDNGPDFIVALYALARLGAICVPFNTALFGAMLSYFVEDSGICAVIADDRYAAKLASLPATRGRVKLWVVTESGGVLFDGGVPVTTLKAMQATASAGPPAVDVAGSDPLMILYTSGTTGPSKGVVCAHSHLHWISEVASKRIELRPEDVFYTCLPLFHVAALWYCVGACIRVGACAVIASRFSASNFWREIHAAGATATMIASSMAVILEKQERTEDETYNPLRIAWLVPVPADIRKFEQRFGLKVITNYSMTEITHVTVGYPGEIYDRPPGCVGKLSGDWDAMIADERDHPVPTGTTGEILVRPRKPGIVFQGYLNKEKETIVAWRNLWFHTGDRAYFDVDGYMYFVDRAKDAIRRRGENISAHEIETLLLAMPALREVAAVPVPSPMGEDDLCVYVILKDDAMATEADIVRFARAEMPRFMVPRYVAIVDDFPRTPSLRVQKFILRQWAANRESLWDGETHGA
jgi:crotonobetaine/carnitine-CoA ligase